MQQSASSLDLFTAHLRLHQHILKQWWKSLLQTDSLQSKFDTSVTSSSKHGTKWFHLIIFKVGRL